MPALPLHNQQPTTTFCARSSRNSSSSTTANPACQQIRTEKAFDACTAAHHLRLTLVEHLKVGYRVRRLDALSALHHVPETPHALSTRRHKQEQHWHAREGAEFLQLRPNGVHALYELEHLRAILVGVNDLPKGQTIVRDVPVNDAQHLASFVLLFSLHSFGLPLRVFDAVKLGLLSLGCEHSCSAVTAVDVG